MAIDILTPDGARGGGDASRKETMMRRDRRVLPPPCLVEVAGVAGAGKSTLTRHLRRDPDFTVADFIHTRSPSHLISVAGSLPRLRRILTSDLLYRHGLSWPEFKLLVYVTQWRRVLRRDARHPGAVTLLDQGPIYALVRLKAEERPFTQDLAFRRWWDEMLRSWADELAAIVWLDAPDAVLWRRINERPQSHRKKGGSADVGGEFITRYRRVFDETLDRLKLVGGPTVLRFDTDGTGAEQLAESIRPVLSGLARSRAEMSPRNGSSA